MQNYTVSNILSPSEILDLLNQPDVIINKEKLSLQNVVKFAITLPSLVKTKLENGLSIDLSQVSTIPMRWIKGDTLPHIDKGEAQFNTTYLIYLTDSVGSLTVGGIDYSIVAGYAHVFSEGLEHSTTNTENSTRLIIGPMSESGFAVGGGISYFNNEDDALNYRDVLDTDGSYTVKTVNGISSWTIVSNSSGTGSPNGGPYTAGTSLIPGPQYYVYPYGAPISNACFPADTLITTDQGIIPIEKINPLKHTIRRKQIIAVTQTTTQSKYLVCFEKNSIGNNIPSEKTIVSKNHLIFNKGEMIMAKDFVGKYENIHKIKYDNEILYNILLKKHDKMIVNNLICETLHPDNMIAKLYTLLPGYDLEEQCKMIKTYNKYVTKKLSK